MITIKSVEYIITGELEAMVPATKGEELPLTNNDVKTNGLPIAAIIGGFIGGVVITAIIASIIVLAIKKTKRGRNPETDLMEPYATIDSSPTSSNKKEPRRSVKHDELMVFEAVTCNYSPPWDVKGDSVDINSEQRTNDSAAYVDAATVRKKKKIDKQKSRELPLSPAQQTNSRDVEYVDAGTVRKKKLADRKSAAAANEAKNNPKRQNATDRKKASEYDRLSRETPRECPTPPGYSHLRREYMDIEPFTLVNENYIEDQGIYENSENVNQEQTNTKKLVPPKNKDSDGGSDSSFKRSPSPVSHYELEKNS
ncbi:hypothetical protein SNE40_019966 [Patella caerulea]|uniref:Uncharacterized protein n=1 Tax=Patella caerulea TaxID=87958 RepID=A0AAN8J006_PATCE